MSEVAAFRVLVQWVGWNDPRKRSSGVMPLIHEPPLPEWRDHRPYRPGGAPARVDSINQLEPESVGVAVDPNGLEILDRGQCLALLASTSVGRIGVSMDALPAVLPATFVLLGANIVIPTSTETRFGAAADRNVVAFEADGRHPCTGGAWSVMVRGVAHLADATSYVGHPAFDRLPTWGPDGLNRVITVSTAVATGRLSLGCNGHDDTIWRF